MKLSLLVYIYIISVSKSFLFHHIGGGHCVVVCKVRDDCLGKPAAEAVGVLSSPLYSMTHFLFLIGSGGSNAARIASSNTFFSPFWVRAEHSTYLTALSSLASFSPCSKVIGFCLFFANFSIVPASSLKSICVPTNRKGVF
uniref:Putative secreted protein n=1 Tax=Panstrongylus lignarius TaxID=156445 RepID=A0A224Y0U6_9HEMI